MYMCKMDSTICNVTTFSKNSNIESLYGILPFSVLLLSATCSIVKSFPHTYTFSLHCLIRPTPVHTGKKYTTDKSNFLFQVRWNACYAIGNMMRNSALYSDSSAWQVRCAYHFLYDFCSFNIQQSVLNVYASKF
jgi:hypothetical protein